MGEAGLQLQGVEGAGSRGGRRLCRGEAAGAAATRTRGALAAVEVLAHRGGGALAEESTLVSRGGSAQSEESTLGRSEGGAPAEESTRVRRMERRRRQRWAVRVARSRHPTLYTRSAPEASREARRCATPCAHGAAGGRQSGVEGRLARAERRGRWGAATGVRGAQAATGGRGREVATEGRRRKRRESSEGADGDGGGGDGVVRDTMQGGKTATGPDARERTATTGRGGGRGRCHGRAEHMARGAAARRKRRRGRLDRSRVTQSGGGRREHGRAAEAAEGAAVAAARAPGLASVEERYQRVAGVGGRARGDTDEWAGRTSERRRRHSCVWRRRGDRAGAASYTAARRSKALADAMGRPAACAPWRSSRRAGRWRGRR